jgi:peptidoglycan/LPS O-acetylase OafA/YrhL
MKADQPQSPTKGRIAELDSVRGIAACVVVVSHVLGVPKYEYGALYDRALSNAAYAAVIVFFVLSGYVLALPFLTRSVSYRRFVVRRFFRIYPPYIAAVAFAFLASSLAGRGRLNGFGELINGNWERAPSATSLANHLSLVWSFPQYHHDLDSPLWSLVFEMRISLVFPLLVAGVLIIGFSRTVLLLPLLGAAGIAADRYSNHHGYTNDWFETLRYVPMFLVGVLLAKYRDALASRFQHLALWARAAWMPVAAGIWFVTVIHVWLGGPLLTDLTDTVAAGMMIVFAVASEIGSRALRHRAPVFVGRISYSLYLLHLVVILAMVHALHGTLPLAVLLGGAVLISFGLAWVSYVLVEVPSMNLGRHLTSTETTKSTPLLAGEGTPP